MNKLPTAAPALTAQQEAYATHYATFGDAVGAYAHAYNPTTTRRASLQQLAYRVRHHPRVSARIVELRNLQAAGDPALSAQALINDLQAMVDLDPETLQQLRTVPCLACWPDEATYCAAVARRKPGEEWPAIDAPRHDCPACAGSGRLVGSVTATADMPLAGRRLLKSLEFHPDGAVKRVHWHDQVALRNELHKLRGMHIERSVSLNLNADLKPLKRGMSVEEALQAMEAFAPTEAAALPSTSDAIDAEFTPVPDPVPATSTQP